MKRILILMLLLCLFLILAVGCADGGESASKPSGEESAETEVESVPDENDNIQSGEITLVPEKSTLNQVYEYISVEIVNNSPYPFSFFYEYNIFEEKEGEFVLVDDDGDGFTVKREDDAAATVISSGDTEVSWFYLWKISDGSYRRPGIYKLRVLINEEVSAEVLFEITEQYIPLETGLSIGMESDVVEGDSEEAFCYFIFNDTEETIQTTLDVYIARYEDGEWVRLSASGEYQEVHYNASLWADNCAPGTKLEREFQLSLADMVDEELTPGKYRLEKRLLSDWYFFEFEVE